jgi:hypothetical protein
MAGLLGFDPIRRVVALGYLKANLGHHFVVYFSCLPLGMAL